MDTSENVSCITNKEIERRRGKKKNIRRGRKKRTAEFGWWQEGSEERWKETTAKDTKQMRESGRQGERSGKKLSQQMLASRGERERDSESESWAKKSNAIHCTALHMQATSEDKWVHLWLHRGETVELSITCPPQWEMTIEREEMCLCAGKGKDWVRRVQ